MVVVGNNVLRIVDAVTLRPLKEYVDSEDRIWVKGDHGSEFFVIVETKNMDSPHIKCSIKVDGNDIGYAWIVHSPDVSPPLGPLKHGQRCEAGEKLTSHAFKFIEEDAVIGNEDTVPLPPAGCVTAKWSAAVESGVPPPVKVDFNTWSESVIGAKGTSHKKDASIVRAGQGHTPSELPMYQSKQYSSTHDLTTATVYYTSDFGLAVRGLLKNEETGMCSSMKNIHKKTDGECRPAKKAKKEVIVLD
jgi:hypothetical protein